MGLIFTYVWAFDLQSDWDYVTRTCHIFESKGWDIYFVELEAELNERILRNNTPHRLEHKATKRNVELSKQNLLATMESHRLNSMEGEITRENYIRINNTDLSAEEVAMKIRVAFEL